MTTDPRIAPDWKRFGQWMARKMEALDMTDRELARRTGLSATHIGKLRTGDTGTKDDTITRIALALHAKPEEAKKVLVRPPSSLTPEQAEMLAILDSVPEDEVPQFLRLAKATSQVYASAR